MAQGFFHPAGQKWEFIIMQVEITFIDSHTKKKKDNSDIYIAFTICIHKMSAVSLIVFITKSQ